MPHARVRQLKSHQQQEENWSLVPIRTENARDQLLTLLLLLLVLVLLLLLKLANTIKAHETTYPATLNSKKKA